MDSKIIWYLSIFFLLSFNASALEFSNKFIVDPNEMKKIQDRAHRYCFIANSLSDEVKVLIN